jgi:carbamoyl-phosphate synthase large subunit
VVKFPRWNFEKFPQADRTLTTQMKSVGEAMAIGRTFKEAFLKAVRSLELGKLGRLFPDNLEDAVDGDEDESALRKRLVVPSDRRIWAIFRALRRGWTIDTIHGLTRIDRWFLQQFADIVALRDMAALGEFREMSTDLLRTLKRNGFSDEDIAGVYGSTKRPCASGGRTRDRSRVQADRYLCRRVRIVHTLHVRDLRRGLRGRPDATRKVIILGSGRTGSARASSSITAACHAVFRISRRGIRNRHGELQSGDGLDRTTTRQTGCTSSRSPSKTSWGSSTASRAPAPTCRASSSLAVRRR